MRRCECHTSIYSGVWLMAVAARVHSGAVISCELARRCVWRGAAEANGRCGFRRVWAWQHGRSDVDPGPRAVLLVFSWANENKLARHRRNRRRQLQQQTANDINWCIWEDICKSSFLLDKQLLSTPWGRKKGTNFLSCASFLILDRNWWFFFTHIKESVRHVFNFGMS